MPQLLSRFACFFTVLLCSHAPITWTIPAGSQGCNLAGIVSGCGQDAADIALAACKHLAEVLQAKEQHPLVRNRNHGSMMLGSRHAYMT